MEVMEPGPQLDDLHKEKIKVIKAYREFIRVKSIKDRTFLRAVGIEGVSAND